MLPVLPLYVESLGGTAQQVGWVMASFAIGLLLSRSVLGQWTDQKGRKVVILIGFVACFLPPLGYFFTKSLLMLGVLRAFHGISIAAFTIAYNALVVDLAPEKQRGEIIGYMSLAIPLGMSFGPAIAGLLEAKFGARVVFLVAAGAGALGLVLAAQIQENWQVAKGSPEQAAGGGNKTWLDFLRSPFFNVPTVIMALVGLVFGSLVTFFPLYVRFYGFEFNIGLYYTAAAISSFLIRLWAGKASDRLGRGIFISLSLICYALAMYFLTGAHSTAALLWSGILEGLASGLLVPMVIALISERATAQERGRAYSVCLAGFDLGIAMAGVVLGGVVSWLTYRGLFLLTGSIAIAALVIFATQINPTWRQSYRFAIGRSGDHYALKS